MQHKRVQLHLLSYCDLLVKHSASWRMPAATCQVQNSVGLSPADVNNCRPCFYPLHRTAFIRRHLFLPSCTHPPRAPVTPLAVRYYSTELAPNMEEEEEQKACNSGVSCHDQTKLKQSIGYLLPKSISGFKFEHWLIEAGLTSLGKSENAMSTSWLSYTRCETLSKNSTMLVRQDLPSRNHVVESLISLLT